MTNTPYSEQQRHEVVQRALELVGRGYVYGGERWSVGTDCSGVAKYAWAPFVSLPHSTVEIAQAHEHVRSVAAGGWGVPPLGRRVPRRIDSRGFGAGHQGHGHLHWPGHWLLPGDLVWYYGDPTHPNHYLSHVALYVGGGRVVNATDERRGIELIRVNAYATRTGYGYVRR